MKKYLLPSALILLLGLGAALTQTINKALQLSQDASGAFGVDTTNNVYFPAHILSTGPGVPVVTSCGGGTPTIVGTDTAGEVTQGTSSTGCIITFKTAYAAKPWCVVTSGTASTPLGLAYTTVATGITTTQASTSSNLINYICSGSK